MLTGEITTTIQDPIYNSSRNSRADSKDSVTLDATTRLNIVLNLFSFYALWSDTSIAAVTASSVRTSFEVTLGAFTKESIDQLRPTKSLSQLQLVFQFSTLQIALASRRNRAVVDDMREFVRGRAVGM